MLGHSGSPAATGYCGGVTGAFTPDPIPVDRIDRLTAAETAEIVTLAQAAGAADGADPLSEAVLLRLRHGGAGAHLLIRDRDDTLAGYAHVDLEDAVDGPWAEVVVHPAHRRKGLGRRLVEEALAVAREADPRGRLRMWAHGDHPSAGALAVDLGFARSRVLLQLRRPLTQPMPERPLPEHVHLRTFEPGRDDAAWLDLNARAFASHPEQGRWTERDLRLRMEEPWFDPAGFLLAVERATGRLLGFHWTKVHDGTPPIGEVYVLGVDPDAHGQGLGAALAVAGLRYLRERGLDRVMLYVEESNVAALTLYRRLGFAHWAAHVLYRHG